MELRYNSTIEIRKFDTVIIPKHAKTNMQGCVAKQMENIWQILEFRISGGLIELYGKFNSFANLLTNDHKIESKRTCHISSCSDSANFCCTASNN